MPRKVQQRQPKRAVYVFWEGESEEAYVKSLKRLFSKQASLRACLLYTSLGQFCAWKLAQGCYSAHSPHCAQDASAGLSVRR